MSLILVKTLFTSADLRNLTISGLGLICLTLNFHSLYTSLIELGSNGASMEVKTKPTLSRSLLCLSILE